MYLLEYKYGNQLLNTLFAVAVSFLKNQNYLQLVEQVEVGLYPLMASIMLGDSVTDTLEKGKLWLRISSKIKPSNRLLREFSISDDIIVTEVNSWLLVIIAR